MSGIEQILLASVIPLATDSVGRCTYGPPPPFLASLAPFSGDLEAHAYLPVYCQLLPGCYGPLCLLFLNQISLACMPPHDFPFCLISFETCELEKVQKGDPVADCNAAKLRGAKTCSGLRVEWSKEVLYTLNPRYNENLII